MNRGTWYFWGVFFVLSVVFCGCEQRSDCSEKNSSSLTEEQVRMLMLAKIEVLPFTKPRSWDDDAVPDGIEVVLRPLDSFGDQTKAIGTFRFELYTYQKASSNPKGQRVGFWEEDLRTRQSQLLHWDKITRTYRFRLAWTGQSPKPGKYVLEVTYLSPSGLRLNDVYILVAQMPREQVKENVEGRRNGGLNMF